MRKTNLVWSLLLGVIFNCRAGVPDFPSTNNYQLEEWLFPTNWVDYGNSTPLNFTNIVNVPLSANGNALLIDTSNAVPAFLFYNIAETNRYNSVYPTIICSNGSITLWLNPDWTSSSAGGTGPGEWANLISLGQSGTNGSSWWAWYLSPDGSTIYFSAQTNSVPATNYLAASVKLLASNWYYLVLTYSPTNSAFYTNGVLVTNGNGVTYWPGPDVTFFAIGSDSNGFYQAESEFSYIQTYNWVLDTNTIVENFGITSIFYGMSGSSSSGSGSTNFSQAPSAASFFPIFDAVAGQGYLTATGTSSTYPTSSNIWFTNYTAANVTTNILDIEFAVAGGSNNVPYDVFATLSLHKPPLSNSIWVWMGQAYRGTNYAIPITNLPPNIAINLVLGTPQDSDGDGLTDAYELLISHTDPHNASSNGSGVLDGWSLLWGLSLTTNSTTQSNLLSNYTYDPVARLQTVAGIRAEVIGFDAQGNITEDQQ